MALNITNITEFIRQRVAEYDAEIDTSDGTAFTDIVIKPLSTIMQPLVDEALRVQESQSLLNASAMSESDLDALVANLFITRRSGATSFGSVRLFFRTPIAFTVPLGSPFETGAGERFLASTTVNISQAVMSLSKDGSLFYMDVPVTAENAGSAGNVAANTITRSSAFGSEVVRITNPNATQGGSTGETNDDLAERAAEAITVRDLVTEPGINTVLLEEFPEIVNLKTFGFGDEEMERDLLTSSADFTLGDLEVVPAAPGVHIGGKVDIVTKLTTISLEQVDIDNATEVVILRDQDDFDELPIPSNVSFENGFIRPGIRIQSIEELDAVTTEPNGNVLVEGRTISTGTDGVLTPDVGLGTSVLSSASAQFQTDEVDASGYITITSGSPTVGAVVTTAYAIVSVDSETQITVTGEVDAVFSSLEYEAGTGDFEFLVDAPSLRFSTEERVRIRFKDDPNSVGLAGIIGNDWRVQYDHIPDIPDIQAFVDADSNRVVASDLLVKFPQPGFASFEILYTPGPEQTLTSTELTNVVVDYINNLPVGDPLEASDIVDILYDNGAEFVDLPFTMTVVFVDRFGESTTITDTSRIEIDRSTSLIPDQITLTEV